MGKEMTKKGAGPHNWGSLMDERELEEVRERLRGAVVEDVRVRAARGDAEAAQGRGVRGHDALGGVRGRVGAGVEGIALEDCEGG